MTREQKKELFKRLIAKSERGTVPRLAQFCGVSDRAVRGWLEPGKSWAPANREMKIWEFFAASGVKLPVDLGVPGIMTHHQAEYSTDALVEEAIDYGNRVKRLLLGTENEKIRRHLKQQIALLEELSQVSEKRVVGGD